MPKVFEPEIIKEKKEKVYSPQVAEEKEPETKRGERIYDAELVNPRIIGKIDLPPGSLMNIGQSSYEQISFPNENWYDLIQTVGPEKMEKTGKGVPGDKSRNTQTELQHQDFGSKLSFFFAVRPPFYFGKGSITNGQATLTSQTVFNWSGNELAGAYVNITDSAGILETRKISSNTGTVITLSQNWTLATGIYNYLIWKPVYLGAAGYPFERLFVMTDIRFGKGASAGADAIFIKFGEGSPEGAITANVGSLYMRTNGGAGTTLYVKESGTGNTGWVAK